VPETEVSETEVSETSRPQEVTSPDGHLRAAVRVGPSGSLLLDVDFHKVRLFSESRLGLVTSLAAFDQGLTIARIRRRSIDEVFPLLSGKTSTVRSQAKELVLTVGRDGVGLDVVVRVADDGLALRYEVPGTGDMRGERELTAWRLATERPWRSWSQAWVANYEGFYLPRQGLPTGEVNFPLLLQSPGRAWVLLTEADVDGASCGWHLRLDPAHPGELSLAAAVDQVNPTACHRPWSSPWRVAIVAADLGPLVESNLVECLSRPSELVDPSFVRPGRVYWSWWAGAPQDQLAPHLAYLETAAGMGWEYYLADAGWREEWLPELVARGQERGVGIFVWFHHRDLAHQAERAARLDRLVDLGVRGVKVDFFDSDAQERIALYDEIASDCASRRLLVNYHGATKPSGERRRWPHLLTREGVYGAEQYKSHLGPTAEHNCTLPYTRNVIGPMDYTPLSFSQCRGQTTLAHQLALPIVFESGLQHLSDPPEALSAYGPGVALLSACPAAWDESRLLAGYPGQDVVLARRRESEWFLGVLQAKDEPTHIEVPLSFLAPRSWRVHTFSDLPSGHSPAIVSETRTVGPDDRLHLDLEPWGGASAWFTPASPLEPDLSLARHPPIGRPRRP
jgi:alpha-glucosidase